jgi:uroporphyrinogen decarboxylase
VWTRPPLSATAVWMHTDRLWLRGARARDSDRPEPFDRLRAQGRRSRGARALTLGKNGVTDWSRAHLSKHERLQGVAARARILGLMPEPTHRFLAACGRRPVDRTPIWLMRQAGRYQASYRKVREKFGFLEICRSPELIAQVTVAPVEQFDFDAAILFSDILIALPAMGLQLSFGDGEKGKGGSGPKIANPIEGRADVEALRLPDPASDLGFVLDGVRAARAALRDCVPLIGFVGGPFTVASYAVEGRGRSFDRLKAMLRADPATAHALFEKLTRAAILQLEAQIAAGVQAAQVFESWLGELGAEDLEVFGFPYLARIAEAVRKTGVPSILFSTGTAAYLERLAALGYDVISVDWRVPITEARARLAGVAVQGNLDPALLLGAKDRLVAQARELLAAAGTEPGYVFNLGHGVLPQTPEENVRALVEAVHVLGVRE